jgi:hypothetical protein
MTFAVTFVIPKRATSETPHAGAVSFAKPWVSLVEESNQPPAIGSTDPCAVVTNPSSWSAGYAVSSPYYNATGQQPRSGVYVDVACPNDGSGFEFYRVRFDDMLWNGQPESVFDTALVDNTVTVDNLEEYSWGSAVQQPSGDHGLLLVGERGTENADMSVCGYNGSGFQCLPGSGGGQLVPSASSITVTEG